MEQSLMEKAVKILSTGYVCDNCLGRQFAQLLKGYSNDYRGQSIRHTIASIHDFEKISVDESNFHGMVFRNQDVESEKKECFVCNGFFKKLDSVAKKAAKKLAPYEFSTFLMGTKLSSDLIDREEGLWETIGIDNCEPIKAEINREIGKRIETLTDTKADFDSPQIILTYDMETGKIDIKSTSVYVIGRYQKHSRDIPQTKWPSGKYKNSVEQIIAKPLMKYSNGKSHALHGCGREDIDAKCLAWRPFVLEVKEPKVRSISLSRILGDVNKSRKVKVKGLRFVDKSHVVRVKDMRPEKSYLAQIKLSKKFEKSKLKDVKKLKTKILQQTPQRVVHRRSDKIRERNVLGVSCKVLGPRKLELKVKAEAGTYIKELISGDGGRTTPSLSEILGVDAKCTALDVVGIHVKGKV